ncbi:MAG: ABC transporter permease [Chloroflexi bacterium]|nr:ABC transporter permease [Chloroflexota bacterium]
MRKELADYFTSIRCFILFLLVFLVGAAGLYAAWQGIRSNPGDSSFVFLRLFTSEGTAIPALISLLALIVPIIGITLGFDAINSERTGGTLSRLLAQPIYRDSVINGKFLAGMVTLAIMVASVVGIVGGYGLRMIGVPPTAEEIIRLFLYVVFTIIYGAFWMAIAVLFSVVFRRVATSLMSSVAVWLFFGFFYTLMIVPAVAKSVDLMILLRRFSPNTLFEEATTVLLLPQWRGSGLFAVGEGDISFMLPNALSLGQSILVVWPQLVSLIALSIICFAISYILFMRQEVRST